MDSSQRVNIDSLMSSVQNTLWANENVQESQRLEVDTQADNDARRTRRANSSCFSERSMVLTPHEAVTNAHPSSHVSVSNFRRTPSANTGLSLPRGQVQKMHEEIFTALRQKFHTVTMIFAYLNSRATDDQPTSRGFVRKSANSAKSNSICRDDFRAAISQLGLGLSEKEILASFDYNADVRTGELTFNNLQRAIQGLTPVSTPRNVSTPR